MAAQNDNALERELQERGNIIVQQANTYFITNQDEYQQAADFLSDIKAQEKKITEYWKPKKDQAHALHRDLCASEKQMLEPFQQAEKQLKTIMVKYQEAMEKIRAKALEEQRKRQQEEADRLLEEAARAEANGDAMQAATNLAMAEMVEDLQPTAMPFEPPKTDGASVKRTWKARIINPEAVPSYANGMEIREINMSALNQIAKLTSGTAKIPGVEFYVETSIAATGK